MTTDVGPTGGDREHARPVAVRRKRIMLQQMPEGKTVKNRLHLDLRPKDQAAEVDRLEALGARRVDVGQGTDVSWVVLADPDGNEFDVLKPLTRAEVG
jgi:Glyoxalase-like domain